MKIQIISGEPTTGLGYILEGIFEPPCDIRRRLRESGWTVTDLTLDGTKFKAVCK